MRTITLGRGLAAALAACVVGANGGLASAQPEAEPPAAPTEEGGFHWEDALDNDYYKIALDLRARMELADFDGARQSEAWTLRTRAGIGTKPLYGFSGYAEVENSAALNHDLYFDGTETPNGRTTIADPPKTGLNQLYGRYQNEEWWKLDLIGGRQRITLDDHRFIGNVGWRQNEQTYDAAWGATSLGVDALQVAYGYVWDVRRIFGDDGPAATRDFDSESHLAHLAYDRFAFAKLALFAYLLDFDNSPGNSADSYGGRLAGTQGLGDSGFSVDYAVSYAYQHDAGDNPVSYVAHYVAADGAVGFAGVGKLGGGYELLGSDDGRGRFVTPLATAHKFNGFADVFLDNGGANGLQDLYVYVAPALPWELTGKVIYHHFWSHENGTELGQELDFVLSRPVAQYFTVLSKGAWFEGRRAGPPDGWRLWLEVSFHY